MVDIFLYAEPFDLLKISYSTWTNLILVSYKCHRRAEDTMKLFANCAKLAVLDLLNKTRQIVTRVIHRAGDSVKKNILVRVTIKNILPLKK